jgi:gluconate 2-dehydrogenase gamma chain
MDRRDALKVLIATPLAAGKGSAAHGRHAPSAATHAAAHAGAAHAGAAAAYKPRFFTADEYALLDALCETIIPADAEGGGAHDAGVAFYIDTRILHSEESRQEFWRGGLAELNQRNRRETGEKFADLNEAARYKLLAALLENERSPRTALERFAVQVKALTIEAYAASEVGMGYFNYQGNTALDEFPGCTHPDHQPE